MALLTFHLLQRDCRSTWLHTSPQNGISGWTLSLCQWRSMELYQTSLVLIINAVRRARIIYATHLVIVNLFLFFVRMLSHCTYSLRAASKSGSVMLEELPWELRVQLLSGRAPSSLILVGDSSSSMQRWLLNYKQVLRYSLGNLHYKFNRADGYTQLFSEFERRILFIGDFWRVL